MEKNGIIYTKSDIFIIEKRDTLNDIEKDLKKDLKEIIALKGLLDCIPKESAILLELKQKQKQLSKDIINYKFAKEELKIALKVSENKAFTKYWTIEKFSNPIQILINTYLNFYNIE